MLAETTIPQVHSMQFLWKIYTLL